MLNDRVLVHVPDSEGERRSRAGILIRPPLRWQGDCRGPRWRRSGRTCAPSAPATACLFNPEECFEVEVKGEDFLILRERDIPAVASERLEDGTGLLPVTAAPVGFTDEEIAGLRFDEHGSSPRSCKRPPPATS